MSAYLYKKWKKIYKYDLHELYNIYILPNFDIDFNKFCIFVYKYTF